MILFSEVRCLKTVYSELFQFYKSSLSKSFWGLLGWFLLSAFIAYFISVGNPILVEWFMGQIMSIFEESGLLDEGLSTFNLAVGLFFNNLQACIVVAITGFIPLFLPAVSIIGINGAMMGVMFAFIQISGQSTIAAFLSGIVPHGIFEIPAIILSGAIAFYISISIFKKLDKMGNFSFKSALKNAFLTFIWFCVPLLLIAAAIEAFVTPHIMGVAGF